MNRRIHEALLALGSNIEPDRYVPRALTWLRRRFEVVAASPWYVSPAVGGPADAPDFVNLAVRLRTDCPPRALREVCRRLEEACDRRRTADRFAPRTLDVDLVLFDDLVASFGSWHLPDDQLATAPFVLVPCADVAPEVVHPLEGRPLEALRLALPPATRAALRPRAPARSVEREP